MRYFALATDYDGTLAAHGRVDAVTVAALARLKKSGRRLLLVTGRELPDLKRVFPEYALFDRVVAENGALLYCPETHARRVLAPAPPPSFVEALQRRGVTPLSRGEVIIATWEPHETAVLECIRDQGLELQVIFNKGAVMVLPSGVNKATGLAAALAELQLSPHNCVAVGDAENDHALLAACECGVAVANALPMLKAHADYVTAADYGAGVVQLIDGLLQDDLAVADAALAKRHALRVGTAGEAAVELPPYGGGLLLAGTSGSGKSTFATAFLERLMERGYQFCIVDPEGDYENLPDAVILGTAKNSPTVQEAVDVIDRPNQNLVVNLLAVGLEHRPQFFAQLLPALLERRARHGRPHWIVFDEAHHLMPRDWAPSGVTVPRDMQGVVLVTVHPNQVARAMLSLVDIAIAIGATPARTLADFAKAAGRPVPDAPAAPLATGEALAWFIKARRAPFKFAATPPTLERHRHIRKYAQGDLGDHAFYFRGPHGRLNLRAQNLVLFMQIADGVDDETWDFHLRRHDYSNWFRAKVKDAELADIAREVEEAGLAAAEARARIRAAIEARYAAPVS